MNITGVVLAAGAGRRLGGPKALVKIGDELLVERSVRMLVDGGCTAVLVVLGAAAEEVIDRADLAPALPVIADDWQDGMAASLHAGLAAAAGTDADAVVVTLVDQPLIGAEAVRRLREAGRAGAVAAVATYGGKPRNPVLLTRSVWASVAESAVGEVGARAWLRSHPDQVVVVDCDGTGDPRDIDTVDDLAKSSRLSAGHRVLARLAADKPRDAARKPRREAIEGTQ